MACELLGGKLISPYFGGSLYVWASVLGVTLTALMMGYYLGGLISSKGKDKWVYWVLVVAGLLLTLMPKTGRAIMPSLLDWSVQSGSLVSLLGFMFPQLLLLGMTSPMIVNILNQNQGEAGKMAGSVYAISTFGGIVATFSMGFYFLPELGVDIPAAIFGLALMFFSMLGMLINKQLIPGLLAAVLILSGLLLTISSDSVTSSQNFLVRYHSDGILGQIKVVDQKFQTFTRGTRTGRILYVNNTAQTIMDLENSKYSLWDWAYYFPAAASVYGPGSDVLLLGLGGGTLVNQFERLGFNQTVVELDRRIKDVAIEYFGIDPHTNITIDDGRHYINVTKKKYDLITLDVFRSEAPPAQLISLESFQRMREILTEDGMVMMNFYGYLTGDLGRAGRSVYKTFKAAGFDTKLLVTPGREGGRNLIFLATKSEKDFTNRTYTEPGLPALGDLTKRFINPMTIDMTDAEVLTDRIPRLEKMYLKCALDWRKGSNQYSTKKFINEGIY